MSHMITGMTIDDLCHDHPHIMSYLETHRDQLMTKTLYYINHTDCRFCYGLYQFLFSRFGLTYTKHPFYVMPIEQDP